LMGHRFSSSNLILKALSYIMVGLLLLLVAISLSRVAYFCVLIGLLYFFWKRGRIQLIGTTILLIFIVSVLPDIIRMRAVQDLPTTLSMDTINRLLAGRLIDRWIPAFRAFAENPVFGKGYNGAGIYVFGQAYQVFPHSGYVATLCDTGIIGLAAMIWLFISFWVQCNRIYHGTKNTITKRLALASKTQIIVLAFSNLSSDHSFFYEPMVVAPFFLTVAMTFALYREEMSMAEKERPALALNESTSPATTQAKVPAS
jgi:O-antigen ligase